MVLGNPKCALAAASSAFAVRLSGAGPRVEIWKQSSPPSPLSRSASASEVQHFGKSRQPCRLRGTHVGTLLWPLREDAVEAALALLEQWRAVLLCRLSADFLTLPLRSQFTTKVVQQAEAKAS